MHNFTISTLAFDRYTILFYIKQVSSFLVLAEEYNETDLIISLISLSIINI